MRLRATLTVVIALLAMQGCTAGTATTPTGTHPPPATGEPVVVDEHVPGWATSVWLAEETFCVRAARTEGHAEGKANEFVFCNPAPADLEATGPPLLPTKPVPYVAPLDPQSREVILVGTVRGPIATVSVTMFGTTTTATVHRLPSRAGREVGAYAVWLPRSGPERGGMNLTDITAVVGRDASGKVVTSLG